MIRLKLVVLMGRLLRVDPHSSVDLFEDEEGRVFRLPETTKTKRDLATGSDKNT